MKTIAILTTQTADGPVLSPVEPFPDNAISVQCDGQQYIVYEPGDTLPELAAS